MKLKDMTNKLRSGPQCHKTAVISLGIFLPYSDTESERPWAAMTRDRLPSSDPKINRRILLHKKKTNKVLFTSKATASLLLHF